MPTVFNYDIHYLSKLLKLFLFYSPKVPLYKDLKLIVTHLVQLSKSIRCIENTKMVACAAHELILELNTLFIIFMKTLK